MISCQLQIVILPTYLTIHCPRAIDLKTSLIYFAILCQVSSEREDSLDNLNPCKLLPGWGDDSILYSK